MIGPLNRLWERPRTRSGELWAHGSPTALLGSLCALNWAYTQACGTYGGISSCYVSLERSPEELVSMYHALHSTHPKFNEWRVSLGRLSFLSYERIEKGELTQGEKELLRDVISDLQDRSQNYQTVQVIGAGSTEMTVEDLRIQTEMLFDRCPFSMLIVDNLQLIRASKTFHSHTDRTNNVFRDLKKLALNFARRGIPLVALFETGLNSGFYDLESFSYFNELERSSDIITTSLFAPSGEGGRIFFQNLKSRETNLIQDFFARLDPSSGRLSNEN